MFLFGKKKSAPITPRLDPDEICCIIEEISDNVDKSYCILSDPGTYTLLYRDGIYLGNPQPAGGPIFPFSDDPTKMGTNSQKKKYKIAKLVCITKDILSIPCGSPFPVIISDPTSGKGYNLTVNGTIRADFNYSDENARTFYETLSMASASDELDVSAVRNMCSDMISLRIAAAVQNYINENNMPAQDLQIPINMMKVSEYIENSIDGIFDNIGLSISRGNGFTVRSMIIKEAE